MTDAFELSRRQPFRSSVRSDRTDVTVSSYDLQDPCGADQEIDDAATHQRMFFNLRNCHGALIGDRITQIYNTILLQG